MSCIVEIYVEGQCAPFKFLCMRDAVKWHHDYDALLDRIQTMNQMQGGTRRRVAARDQAWDSFREFRERYGDEYIPLSIKRWARLLGSDDVFTEPESGTLYPLEDIQWDRLKRDLKKFYPRRIQPRHEDTVFDFEASTSE